jgi:hypothetical protein
MGRAVLLSCSQCSRSRANRKPPWCSGWANLNCQADMQGNMASNGHPKRRRRAPRTPGRFWQLADTASRRQHLCLKYPQALGQALLVIQYVTSDGHHTAGNVAPGSSDSSPWLAMNVGPILPGVTSRTTASELISDSCRPCRPGRRH